MASAYFLRKQFEEVLVYLNSIKVTDFKSHNILARSHYPHPFHLVLQTFFLQDDIFNFNYGQALLMNENYEEAEKSLLNVSSHTLISSLTYCLFLARACELAVLFSVSELR
jgi:intraflagellar transport protein 56